MKHSEDPKKIHRVSYVPINHFTAQLSFPFLFRETEGLATCATQHRPRGSRSHKEPSEFCVHLHWDAFAFDRAGLKGVRPRCHTESLLEHQPSTNSATVPVTESEN